MRRVVIVGGGSERRRTTEYLARLCDILRPICKPDVYEDNAAFSHLMGCRLLILLGCHEPRGMGERYVPLSYMHKQFFGGYVSSGRPLVVVGNSAASYPDWPRFAELAGFRLPTLLHHVPLPSGRHRVTAHDFAHPIMQGVEHIPASALWPRMPDPAGGVEVKILASVEQGIGSTPLVALAEGGARPGAGTSCYLGLQDEPTTLEDPAIADLWRNTVLWALEDGVLSPMTTRS